MPLRLRFCQFKELCQRDVCDAARFQAKMQLVPGDSSANGRWVAEHFLRCGSCVRQAFGFKRALLDFLF